MANNITDFTGSNGIWKVFDIQDVTNVTEEGGTTSLSRIKFTRVVGTSSATCALTGAWLPGPNNFVADDTNNSLPVLWEESYFSMVGGLLSGAVLSADGSTSHDVLMSVAGGILTCVIDPNDSPGGVWHGTHP